MTEKDLSQKIFAQIEAKKIKPKPKWSFIVKDSVVWILVIVSLGVGSLATSVVIYMIDTNQWDLYKKVHDNILTFIVVTLPYFWLVILAIFVLFIYYNFKHTKGGYKYRAYAVIITSVLMSLFLGLLFYNIGFAQAIDRIFEEKMPMYQNLINQKKQVFNHPEKGILPGKIIKIISPSQLLIIDPQKNQWQVIVTDRVINCPCDPGNNVVLVGEKVNEGIFEAFQIKELRPLPPRPQKIRQYFQLRIWQKQQ